PLSCPKNSKTQRVLRFFYRENTIINDIRLLFFDPFYTYEQNIRKMNLKNKKAINDIKKNIDLIIYHRFCGPNYAKKAQVLSILRIIYKKLYWQDLITSSDNQKVQFFLSKTNQALYKIIVHGKSLNEIKSKLIMFRKKYESYKSCNYSLASSMKLEEYKGYKGFFNNDSKLLEKHDQIQIRILREGYKNNRNLYYKFIDYNYYQLNMVFKYISTIYKCLSKELEINSNKKIKQIDIDLAIKKYSILNKTINEIITEGNSISEIYNKLKIIQNTKIKYYENRFIRDYSLRIDTNPKELLSYGFKLEQSYCKKIEYFHGILSSINKYPKSTYKHFFGLKINKLIPGSSSQVIHASRKRDSIIRGYYDDKTKDIIIKAFYSYGDGNSIFHHELFHALDNDKNNDNYHWQRLTKGTYSTRSFITKIFNNSKDYSRSYGMTDIDEDQATIAEMLFPSATNRRYDLLEKMYESKIFRIKVELLTGCKWSVDKMRFMYTYSPEQLRKKYGLNRHLYYAKWSNINGKVLMNHTYWNLLLGIK
ncbi:hypothetical protein OAR19_00620, partial [bacterium]|nr:hypothetical protein [bacterium]